MKLGELMEKLAKGKPRRAGEPDAAVFEMPMETPVVAKGDPKIKPEEYDSVLEADASFFPTDRVEGRAWRLTVRGTDYEPRQRSRRYGKGPVVAEMKAIVDGMKEADRMGAGSLIVRTDNRWCAHVLVGLWKAKQAHTRSVAIEAFGLVDRFEAVAIVHTRTKNIRRIDRVARRAARTRRADVERKERKRLDKMKDVIGRASSVRLQRLRSGWQANGVLTWSWIHPRAHANSGPCAGGMSLWPGRGPGASHASTSSPPRGRKASKNRERYSRWRAKRKASVEPESQLS